MDAIMAEKMSFSKKKKIDFSFFECRTAVRNQKGGKKEERKQREDILEHKQNNIIESSKTNRNHYQAILQALR